jgi:hypothetical protein
MSDDRLRVFLSETSMNRGRLEKPFNELHGFGCMGLARYAARGKEHRVF